MADAAAARKAKILARGEARLNAVRGITSDAPTTAADKLLDDALDNVLPSVRAPTVAAPAAVAAPVVAAPSPSTRQRATSPEATPASGSTAAPAATPAAAPAAADVQRKTERPAVTEAPAPAPAPTKVEAAAPPKVPLLRAVAPVLSVKARRERTARAVYTALDRLLLLFPVLLGLCAAAIVTGCGWAEVPANAGAVSAWLGLVGSSASGGDAASLREAALEKLGGRVGGEWGGGGAEAPFAAAVHGRNIPLPAPLSLPLVVFERCGDLWSLSTTPSWSYALLLLAVVRLVCESGADALVAVVGAPLRKSGGMGDGIMSLATSFLAGRGGAVGTAVSVASYGLRFAGALRSAAWDAAVAVFVTIVGITLAGLAVAAQTSAAAGGAAQEL